jgi:hypothetical protein
VAENTWGLKVRLDKHIGISDTPLGPSEVEVPQWIVMVGSRQIEMNYGVPFVEAGIAGYDSKSVEFMSHTGTWPPEAKNWICEEVGRMTNSIRQAHSPAVLRQKPVEDLDDTGGGIEDLDE